MPGHYSNTISVDFANPSSPIFLNSQLYKGYSERGWSEFTIENNSEAGTAWPNTCAPIAGVMEHYREKGCVINCSWEDNDDFLSRTHAHNPLIVAEHIHYDKIERPLNTVWKYSDSIEISVLIDSVVKHLITRASIASGVLQGIQWCLYEAMDNILQHSQASCGYFMGAYMPSSNKLATCIFDNGIGIYNSLKNTQYNPKTELDAITLALQERVTRDNSIGQGNGMWGLSRLVENNGGSYTVASNGAKVAIINGKPECHEKTQHGVVYYSENLGTTMVDFQLNCDQSIDVPAMLNGYSPPMLWLDDMESSDGQSIKLKIADEPAGTGTRHAGACVRIKAMNLLRQTKKRIVLDFQNVSLVSSSFADELIGKLVIEIGFSRFEDCFSIRGLTDLNRSVVDRSVQQRMAQFYYSEFVDAS